MRFDTGCDEVRISDYETSRADGGWNSLGWPAMNTYTRVRASGCYAYQVDGIGFSYHIVFKAVGVESPNSSVSP